MLYYFEVSNYRSFQENVRLNFIPVKQIKTLESHILHKDNVLSALETAVIFGPNASGKSNLVKAMFQSWTYIRQGVLQDKAIPCAEPFRLNKKEDDKSRFEYCFSVNGDIYTYGFVVTKEAVIEEWLVRKRDTKEVCLFERYMEGDKQKFDFSKDLEKIYGHIADELVFRNVLFLTTAGPRNIDLRPVLDWFVNTLHVIPVSPFMSAELIYYMNENPEFVKFLSSFLARCDTDVSKIESVAIENPPEEIIKPIYKEISGKHPNSKIETRFFELQSLHERTDGTNVLFNLDLESDGTRQLLHLAPWLYKLKKREITLVVDELDRSLHTFLTHEILNQFRYLNCNSQYNSQMIMTTHDTNLMNADSFRKDEIWLMSKNPDKASLLTCLAEYRLNSGVNYEKLYLNGRLGGIPFIDDDQLLDFTEHDSVSL